MSFTQCIRKTLVILISGKRCSGKDTAASILSDMYKHKSPIIRHIGYYPKKLYSEIHHVDLQSLLHKRDFKELHRTSIINIATKARSTDNDVWIKALYDDCLYKGTSNSCIIIPDYRFPNEFTFLQKFDHLNVKRIRIEASISTLESRNTFFDPNIDTHPSETELTSTNSDWDLIVNNDENVAMLSRKLSHVPILFYDRQ